MSQTTEVIIRDITAFIKRNGGNPSDWYVGIAANPKERLEEHGVKEGWIHREAESATVARQIEAYFIEKVGTDGGSGGGDDETKHVYAYKKKDYTDP